MRFLLQGFGERLREERERIGLNQTELAEMGGIKRMAQGQYEHEIRSPTVRYLAAVAGAGIDVQYLLFGRDANKPTGEQRALEKRAFEMVEVYAGLQPDGRLGAEGRYAMFELFRASMKRSMEEGRPVPDSPEELMASLGLA